MSRPMSLLRPLGFLVLAGAAAGGFAIYRLERPYQGFRGETFVEFPRGAGTTGIADALAKAGVVRSHWDFLLARIASRKSVLQAGEYRFDRAASPMEVVRRIARGDIFYYELTVPEGRNLFEIAAAIEQLGLFPAPKFLEAARDPALIRDLDPLAPTLEGYLFPHTYKPSRRAPFHQEPGKATRPGNAPDAQRPAMVFWNESAHRGGSGQQAGSHRGGHRRQRGGHYQDVGTAARAGAASPRRRWLHRCGEASRDGGLGTEDRLADCTQTRAD